MITNLQSFDAKYLCKVWYSNRRLRRTSPCRASEYCSEWKLILNSNRPLTSKRNILKQIPYQVLPFLSDWPLATISAMSANWWRSNIAILMIAPNSAAQESYMDDHWWWWRVSSKYNPYSACWGSDRWLIHCADSHGTRSADHRLFGWARRRPDNVGLALSPLSVQNSLFSH